MTRDLFGEAPTPKPPAATSKSSVPATDLDPARAPRFRLFGRKEIFDHPCSVCGAPDAPFGTGVFLSQKRLGTWLCGECRRNTKR